MNELMWTFDIDYTTQDNCSYVQLFSVACMFSMIIPSYIRIDLQFQFLNWN